MTKNRIIALMLAALLLTCALLTASCGKKKPSDDTNQRTDDNYPDYLKGKT